jgi:hypothetical protein
VPTASEGLLPTDSNTSPLTYSDLDHIYMQVSASSDIDDASKCWYQIFVDCAKYLLCFRNSQHERAQAHIADAAKAISLLKVTNLSSVPTQIVPCFKGVVACCRSRISELGPAVSPFSFARPVIIGTGVAAEVCRPKMTSLRQRISRPFPSGSRQAIITDSVGTCCSNNRFCCISRRDQLNSDHPHFQPCSIVTILLSFAAEAHPLRFRVPPSARFLFL